MKTTTTKGYEALARDIANSPVIDAALPPTTDRYDHAILEEDNRRLSFFQLALKIEMLCDAPKEWANQYGQILADVTESTINAFQCRFEDMDKKTRAAMFDIAEWPAETSLPSRHVDVDKVMSVYSGRKGCCCGCRGKHTYKSEFAEVAERRGGAVSDRTVKMIVNKMNKMLADPDAKVMGDDLGDVHFISVDTEERTYIAYYRES